MIRLLVSTAVVFVAVGTLSAQPPGIAYLYEGKLAEGEKELKSHLTKYPADDQARLGLAAVQLFRVFERVGTDMHKYGLRTKSLFLPLPTEWSKLMPENPKPERFTNVALRKMVQQLIDDANRIDANLAKIKDPKVQLPLKMGKVRIDLFGQGKLVSVAMFIEGIGLPEGAKRVEELPINFDYSDVAWLRGYCNFVAGAGETMLAMDTQPLHFQLAHRLFRNPDTLKPKQLADYDKRVSAGTAGTTPDFDFSLFMRPYFVKEPARLRKALAHFEAVTEHSLTMWTRILAETKDDSEWIPSPRQRGAFGAPITADMVRIMQTTLSETQGLLKGTKVLTPPPHPLLKALGNKTPEIGVNVRLMFLVPPKVFDVPTMLAGPGLVSYITPGPASSLTGQPMIDDINRVFPGPLQLLGFAARTN
jgi:hypothetical protein